ncbi:MAG: T9SS type A sorting domain-containing protein [Cytophagales bacterium]
MKQHIQIILILFFGLKNYLFAENIGGIINIYAKVIDISYPCNSFEIENPTGTFQTDDLVIIIQMKGASTSRTLNASYGDITAMGNAGNYEWNEIESISGNFVTFKKQLLRTYDVPGKVQLVKVPVYENANTISTLKALPWNGEIGGVLALKVKQTLVLNDSVSVLGMGFKGGDVNVNGGGSCFNNIFEGARTNANIAGRGESIAEFTPNNEHGRGKQANGGGGGGGNNTGGGGGGNGGSGGRSGRQSSPGCTFDGPFAFGGISLPHTHIYNRVYLGGGGGGGHQNNLTGSGPPSNPGSTPGAKGGGIIFIKAQTIENNGAGIFADADIVKNSPSFGDGAGGGGAGGTIVLDVNSFSKPTIISTKGSDGGDAIDFTGRNMGTGGGGGGGAIWFTNPTLPLNVSTLVNGGRAGLTSVCNCVFGAVDGGNGLVILNHNPPKSNDDLDLTACALRFKPVEMLKNPEKQPRFYPNPIESQMNIVAEKDLEALLVYRLDGSEILNLSQINQRKLSIETQDWKKGTYLLKLIYSDGAESFKVLK